MDLPKSCMYGQNAVINTKSKTDSQKEIMISQCSYCEFKKKVT